MDPDTVQNFIDSGFSLGFHGHQHRPQFLDTRFLHGPDRRITVISAGTLCGGPAFRFGRAYNVVEIDIENQSGRLHSREMQNPNLTMPIWGARSIPPNDTTHLDFSFDPPPVPFVKLDHDTIELDKAQALYESGDFKSAADIFGALLSTEPLARPLLLGCLLKLDDAPIILTTFDPPESAQEAIAVMDALWGEKESARLVEILDLPLIKASNDVSVIEIRNKYVARLRK